MTSWFSRLDIANSIVNRVNSRVFYRLRNDLVDDRVMQDTVKGLNHWNPVFDIIYDHVLEQIEKETK